MALDKGAQAVIFDIRNDASAAAEVSVQTLLKLELPIRKKHAEVSHSV